MASYQDLLDAIARVREATGDPHAWQSGLSGADIAVASSPISPPGAVGAVLAKVVAGHPAIFGPPAGPAPRTNEGAAADAIRAAETALAQQHSRAAQVDLQVVSAVLKAHTAHTDGADTLEQLQREVEAAVLSRADLDTPAGARELQRFLIGKVRDIRGVVQAADLDAASKAALAEALAALYVSSTPEAASATPPAAQPDPPVTVRPERDSAVEERAPRWPSQAVPEDLSALADYPAGEVGLPVGAPLSLPGPVPVAATTPAAPTPLPMAGPLPDPGWGTGMPAGMPPAMSGPMPTGMPSGMPFGGGFPPLPSSALSDVGSDVGQWRRGAALEQAEPRADDTDHTDAPAEEARAAEQAEQSDPATTVRLPDGDSVTAPSPELAAAVTAAVAGTPIADAFHQQGITLPPPGSPVMAPLDAARLMPGDIGVYADRYALALGHGKALVDSQIQPIDTVTGPDFLGWLQPPVARPMTTPEVPAPNRPVPTAPS